MIVDDLEAVLRDTYGAMMEHGRLREEHGRRGVGDAHRCGCLLIEARETSEHREGGFRGVCQRTAISSSHAYRLIELAEGYPEVSRAGHFTSINEALRALKAPADPALADPDPDPDPEQVPADTVTGTVQDAEPAPAPVRRVAPVKRPTMGAKLTDAAERISQHGREVADKDLEIAELRQQVRLLNDHERRPDAAARIQELAKSQAEARTYRSSMMEWQQRYEDERRRGAFFLKVLKRHNLADAKGKVIGA